MITIKFNNPNSRTLTTIDLYREEVDTPIPDLPVNPPIVTLDGWTTEYIDHTTELGKDYNYRFRVYKQGGESVMSDNIVLGDVSLYGPGAYTVATTGSDKVWSFGEVTDATLLPTLEELMALAGGNGIPINWQNKWTKFKVGADIFYTPYQFAISIPSSDVADFMRNIVANREFRNGYCHYQHLTYMHPQYASTVLDGRFPSFGNFEKETGRVNPVEYFSGLGGGNPNVTQVIYAVATETSGQLFKQPVRYYTPALIVSPDLTNPSAFEWFWKPVIQFIPQSERNYD